MLAWEGHSVGRLLLLVWLSLVSSGLLLGIWTLCPVDSSRLSQLWQLTCLLGLWWGMHALTPLCIEPQHASLACVYVFVYVYQGKCICLRLGTRFFVASPATYYCHECHM